MKKVLVILGHPRLGSYGNALSQVYERGAVEVGAEVRRLDLARLEKVQRLGARDAQTSRRTQVTTSAPAKSSQQAVTKR